MVETLRGEPPLKVDFPFTVPTPLIERLKSLSEGAVPHTDPVFSPTPESSSTVDVVA